MSFTASNRRTALVAVLVLLVLAVQVGCVPRSAVTSAPANSITVIAGPAAVNLNPYTNVLASRQVASLLFRGMFGVDAEGRPVPDLAVELPQVTNGGMSDDGRRITYRLDPDARWADGEPLTADDVIFTWDLIVSGALVDDPRGVSNVRSVSALDEHTLALELASPDAPFAWRFVPYVLPQHLLEGSTDLLSDEFWFRPVGSRGRLAERSVKNTQVDLVDVTGVHPTIRVVFTETDEAALEVWESEDSAVWLDPPVAPTGAEQQDTVAGGRWQAFVMNAGLERPTSDLAVRQAFSQLPTLTVEPGQVGPYGAPLGDWSVSEQEVVRSLRDAGWVSGEDGYRTKAGDPLIFKIMFNPMSAEDGYRIENYLEPERLGADVAPVSSFGYTAFHGESRLVLGDYDVALVDMPIGVPFGWAWPFCSDDIPSEDNPAGLNVMRVADPELDAAYDAIKGARTLEEWRAAVDKAWKRVEQQRYVLYDKRWDETVMFKGTTGVKAQAFEDLALRAADDWQVIGADAGE